MQDAQITKEVQRRYKLLSPEMDERMRRQWAAVEAQTLGWGGITTVSHATGLTYPTIAAGLAELDLPAEERRAEACRIRRPGGGRHSLRQTDPELLVELESLIEPLTRGIRSRPCDGPAKAPGDWPRN